MSNPLGYLSLIKEPLLMLYKWAKKRNEIKKSKERLTRAIKDETEDYLTSFEEMNKLTDELLPLLDNLNEEITKEKINLILEISSKGLFSFGELINSYVKLSFAIKEFSVNENLMKQLNKADEFLYDFVQRISDTVIDYKYVHIGGEYYRFFKAYEDKIFKKVNKKDIDRAVDEIYKYIDILKNKFRPALIIMSNRRRFKKKYIKRLFIGNIKHLSEAKNKFKSDISTENVKEYIPKKFLSMTIIFDEISMLEYKPKKGRRHYLKQYRKRKY